MSALDEAGTTGPDGQTGWRPTGAATWGGRPVARTVADAGPRQRAVLRGRVAWCRLEPRNLERGGPEGGVDPQGLEVGLDDGTGVMALRWLGRDAVPGVTPGATLVVEGTVLATRRRLVILNPLYEATSW